MRRATARHPGHPGTCRCDLCAAVRYRYDKAWRLEVSTRGHRQVPAGPTRERLRVWLDQGWSAVHLAHLLDVDHATVTRIAQGGSARVHRDIAAAAARVAPSARNAPTPASPVPAVGAIRRVEALMALGWTTALIEAEMPRRVHVTRFMVSARDTGVCMARTWLAVDAAYRSLSGRRGPSLHTRRRAAKAGYAPPLAWDDIDDPNAVPQTGADRSRGVQVEDAEWLLEGGSSLWEVASRLGVSVPAVDKALRRAGRADLLREVAS